jgi:hypothetical protein
MDKVIMSTIDKTRKEFFKIPFSIKGSKKSFSSLQDAILELDEKRIISFIDFLLENLIFQLSSCQASVLKVETEVKALSQKCLA